jgi:phage protein D
VNFLLLQRYVLYNADDKILFHNKAEKFSVFLRCFLCFYAISREETSATSRLKGREEKQKDKKGKRRQRMATRQEIIKKARNRAQEEAKKARKSGR